MPKQTILVGDRVRHDFTTETHGTVIAIEDDADGYDYLVRWDMEDGTKKEYWMDIRVLEKVERVKCSGCKNEIHVDHFAGAKKGENGEEFYCDSLPCLMKLQEGTK